MVHPGQSHGLESQLGPCQVLDEGFKRIACLGKGNTVDVFQGNVRQGCGVRHGVFQVAEFVHQPLGQGVGPSPNTASCHLFHFRLGHSTTLGHPGREGVVDVGHAFVDGRQSHRIRREHAVRLTGVVVKDHFVERDAGVLLQHASQVRNHPKHPNGPRDGGRVGVNAVCGATDVVPARSREVAHADHKGLAGLLEQHRFTPNHVARQRAAAWGIHTQHHRLHVVGLTRLTQRLGCGF